MYERVLESEFVTGWLIVLTLAVVIALLLPFAIDIYKKHKDEIK